MGVIPFAGRIFSNPITVQSATIAFPNDAVYMGFNAGAAKYNNGASSNDVMIGYEAGKLYSTVSPLTFHTFVGFQAGAAGTAGAGGTVVGQKALTQATTIQSSVAIGGKAGATVVNANEDTFVGYGAAQFVTTTNTGQRVFVGYSAGSHDAGDFNIAIGYQAGAQTSNPTTGNNNIAIGKNTLTALNGGTGNTVVGQNAGINTTSASSNTFIGYQAGRLTTSAENTCVGYQAGEQITTGNRNICLGVNAGGTAPTSTSNTFIAGASSNNRIDNVYFGKGVQDGTPTGYTIRGTASRAGTDSDTGGGNVTVCSGLGTGTGAISSLILASPVAVASGSTAQTQTTGLTIKNGCAVRPSYTVATLPSASATGAGAMAWVTDANATTFLSVVAGGGANKVPVSSDGTNWLIG